MICAIKPCGKCFLYIEYMSLQKRCIFCTYFCCWICNELLETSLKTYVPIEYSTQDQLQPVVEHPMLRLYLRKKGDNCGAQNGCVFPLKIPYPKLD